MPLTIPLRRARLAGQLALQASAAAASNDPLAVRELRAWPLREPESGRRYTVLRIETRGGLRGYGEASGIELSGIATAQSLIAGLPASAYEVVARRLAPEPRVAAAVDMALLDILGKAAKAPVFQVLGGPTRNKARALLALPAQSDQSLAGSVRQAVQEGHRAFSVPVTKPEWRNQGREYVLKVKARADAWRAAAGPGADLVLRGDGHLNPGDAASIAAALEKFHLLWFDEPCSLAALGAVRKIAAGNVTPLGFGVNLDHASRFQDLLREDAVDILRPSLALHGVAAIRRIAAIAETYYIAVAPHNAGGPIATAAGLHAAASIPNFFIQEIPHTPSGKDRSMRAEIAGLDLESPSGGFLTLPATPGLGISVNESALEKYRERAA